jgi:hypothetical protein
MQEMPINDYISGAQYDVNLIMLNTSCSHEATYLYNIDPLNDRIRFCQ